ncbi:hotdog fold thioesterase [Actinomycetaceae bacterium TAE3-ERU4]|nr:hotdog fold thioesterase [Actinomycetaceae bacterium TAE3-ERU4]
MGIQILDYSAENATATMPVEGNTQPFGILHGGASAVLAETIGSACATIHAHKLGKIAVGTELSISHLHSVTSGTVTAQAKSLHTGRTSAVYLIEIYNEQQILTAHATLRCALLESRN